MENKESAQKNLIKECKRQFESCLYTSAALFVWEKHARLWRGFFLIAPIVLGAIASSQLLTNAGEVGKIVGAFCGLLAGIFPAIFKALNLDLFLEGTHRAATEFTNLRDRFRGAATVTAFAPIEEFKAQVEQLMDRMDAVRTSSPPIPEWCFRKAQKKVQRGDFSFDADD